MNEGGIFHHDINPKATLEKSGKHLAYFKGMLEVNIENNQKAHWMC